MRSNKSALEYLVSRGEIPKVKGHVNHVFNGDLIYLIATLLNRLVDAVNILIKEVSHLNSRISELEKERDKGHEESSL